MTEPAFDVFDVHHHVGRAFDALGGDLDPRDDGAGSVRRLSSSRSAADHGRGRRAAGMVIPGHGYLRPNGIADTRGSTTRSPRTATARPNGSRSRAASSNRATAPPRSGRSTASPTSSDWSRSSFHTRFQGVSLDSRWIVRYLERMGERGLVP